VPGAEPGKRVAGALQVTRTVPIEDEIAAVRSVLPRCWFDEGDCKRGIDALKLYRAKWDEERKVLTRKAVHDWTSHSAHAFAYLAVTIDNLRDPGSSQPIRYPRTGIF
jgi:phage terminase large subunit